MEQPTLPHLDIPSFSHNNTSQHSIVIRITASNGSVGLGNVDPLPGYSVETIEQSLKALREVLAPAIQGRDAGNINQILDIMDAALSGFLEAKAALEMACLDLTSRAMNLPVHRYLGGALVDCLRFNAWIMSHPIRPPRKPTNGWHADSNRPR